MLFQALGTEAAPCCLALGTLQNCVLGLALAELSAFPAKGGENRSLQGIEKWCPGNAQVFCLRTSPSDKLCFIPPKTLNSSFAS